MEEYERMLFIEDNIQNMIKRLYVDKCASRDD